MTPPNPADAQDRAAQDRAVQGTLSVRQTAAYLELGVTTVRRLIAEGQLDAYRITVRKVRVLRASVLRYREEQTAAPPYDEGIQEQLRRSRRKRA